MKKFGLVFVLILGLVLSACNTAPAAATATAVPPTTAPPPTETPVPPTPIPPTATLAPTAIPVTDVTAYLLAHGLALDPAKPKCDSPCKGYASRKLGIKAVVYDNGKAVYTFILTNSDSSSWVADNIPALYGDDVFQWFTTYLVPSSMSGPQTGSVNGYSLRVESNARDFSATLTVAPE